MSTTQEVVQSWDEFDDRVRAHTFRDWIYRGESDATWELKSTLYRVFEYTKELTHLASGKPKKINRSAHEKAALQRFMCMAHQFNVPLPKDLDPLEWLAVMQHYGGPTRLLDATFSPYVAAYFAVESGVADAAVYCLEARVFNDFDERFVKNADVAYKRLLAKDDAGTMYAYEPKYSTPRLLAQQGLFLVAGSLAASHEQIMDEYGLGEREAVKLVIPKSLRSEFIRNLRRMNITAAILFPDISGFCRAFNHQVLFQIHLERRIGDAPLPS